VLVREEGREVRRFVSRHRKLNDLALCLHLLLDAADAPIA
jgi:hypothetical protein